MNLPNKLSMLRIILVPIMIFFYLADFIPYAKIVAFAVFIIAACTDFLDGYIARKYNLVTDLGKLLDPMADKLLVISALLLVVADKTIFSPVGVIFAIIIIGRELLVSTFRQIAAAKNVVIAADKFGKVKTILQDIALPAYILLAFLNDLSTQVEFNDVIFKIYFWTTNAVMSLAVIFTIISGINYIVKNRQVLQTSKEAVSKTNEVVLNSSKEDEEILEDTNNF